MNRRFKRGEEELLEAGGRQASVATEGGVHRAERAERDGVGVRSRCGEVGLSDGRFESGPGGLRQLADTVE